MNVIFASSCLSICFVLVVAHNKNIIKSDRLFYTPYGRAYREKWYKTK